MRLERAGQEPGHEEKKNNIVRMHVLERSLCVKCIDTNGNERTRSRTVNQLIDYETKC